MINCSKGKNHHLVWVKIRITVGLSEIVNLREKAKVKV